MADRPKRRPDGSRPTDEPFPIRQAVPRDARAIAALERRCFSDPWSEESFREAITAGWTCVLVAERVGELVGYVVGREVAGTGEILNLAVAPGARRHGLGRQLLEAGVDALAARGAEEIFLEVRESNLGARALYASAGFRPVGQRSGYYRYPSENAVVLRLPLGGRA
jgi:ribosomal-protein-alanine N-acetyltransferase